MDPFERVALPYRARRQRLTLIILSLFASALLLLGKAEAYVFDQARDTVSEATAPVLEVFSMPIAVVRGWLADLDGLIDVYEENRRLRAENERLREWKDTALRMEQTAARYEALLNVQLDPDIGYVTGRVISESGGPFVRTYIVNVGKKNGITKGQAVIDTRGLVGRILGVGAKASRILAVNDLNSRIPVVISPSNVRAILVGDNEKTPKLSFLPDDVVLNSGDRVETSGYEGLLPRGLPVGEVVPGDEQGTYRVKLFTDPSRIDFVRILQFSFPKMDDKKEGQPELGANSSEGIARLSSLSK